MAEVSLEVKEDSPSSPENPPLSEVIVAAIQTGAAAEKAEAAAAEATETLAEAKAEATDLRTELRQIVAEAVAPLAERIAEMEADSEAEAEAEAEELTIPGSEDVTDESASAEIVELDVPKEGRQNSQQPEQKPEAKSGGGFLKKMFLNL